MCYFYSLINLLGGLALFLYGVQQCADFFRNNLSSGAREIMVRFTARNTQAFCLGMGLSAITQSSTIATSFAVGFVDVGMLSFAGSLYVMMGASLGGTFVSFLLSLNLFDYAPLLFGLAFFLGKVKNRLISSICGLLQCLSLIFIGMLILGMGTAPLFEDPMFCKGIAAWAGNPLAMGIIAFLGSGILQSSSAIMALGITLSAVGALPAESALPIALGAHIGSTTMVVLAGMGGRLSAKRLGYATFFFKLIGGLLFLAVSPFFHSFFVTNGFSVAHELVYGQVLIATFNILVFLPCPRLLEWLVVRLVSGEAGLGEPRYLEDQMLQAPEIATLLLSKEMGRLANYMEAYLQMLLEPSQRDGKLFPILPEAMKDLSGACQEYAYKIHISSDNEQLVENFKVICYTLANLRGMQKLLCGALKSNLESVAIHETFCEVLGTDVWTKWCKLSRSLLRTSLRAFVIGEQGLMEDVIDMVKEHTLLSSRIRCEVGATSSYMRTSSRAIRLISLMQGFLTMAKEVAQAEEFAKGGALQRAEELSCEKNDSQNNPNEMKEV